MAVTYSGDAATTRANLGLGSLATKSAVGAAEITDNSVGAAELNVSGNGTAGQALTSDGDGTFSWTTLASGGSITPTTGAAPYYGARAWVSFNGTGTVAIRSSANVSSISDNGTGDYTVNFSTAMPAADYAYALGVESTGNNIAGNYMAGWDGGCLAGSLRMYTTAPAWSRPDRNRIGVIVFR